MLRMIFILLLLLTLTACSTAEDPVAGAGDDATGQADGDADGTSDSQLAGGNSGAEGSYAPCMRRTEALEGFDASSEILGLSADALLDSLGRTHELPMRWEPQDGQPSIAGSEDLLRLALQPGDGLPSASECEDDPDYPQELVAGQPPEMEVPISLSVETQDGRLAERFDATLIATSEREARVKVDVGAGMLKGDLGALVTDFFMADETLVFELNFDERGPRGGVSGPFSLSASNPCRYTAYGSWPLDVRCEDPTRDAQDIALLAAALSGDYALAWSDLEGDAASTVATVEVTPRTDMLCEDGNAFEGYATVDVHIVTADGRLDLALPGQVSGAIANDGEGPAARETDAVATLMLTAESLQQHFEYEGDADAGMLELWLSNLAVVGAPPRQGGLELSLLDRSGFDTVLPAGNPGGAARCFNAAGRQPGQLLRAELSSD